MRRLGAARGGAGVHMRSQLARNWLAILPPTAGALRDGLGQGVRDLQCTLTAVQACLLRECSAAPWLRPCTFVGVFVCVGAGRVCAQEV